KPSSRRYPHVVFEPPKLQSKHLLTVKGLCKRIDGAPVLNDVSLTVQRDEKVVFVADDGLRTTTLLDILAGNQQPDAGTVEWGSMATHGYFPKDHGSYFTSDLDLVDW